QIARRHPRLGQGLHGVSQPAACTQSDRLLDLPRPARDTRGVEGHAGPSYGGQVWREAVADPNATGVTRPRIGHVEDVDRRERIARNDHFWPLVARDRQVTHRLKSDLAFGVVIRTPGIRERGIPRVWIPGFHARLVDKSSCRSRANDEMDRIGELAADAQTDLIVEITSVAWRAGTVQSRTGPGHGC